jgi:hypothetical protein
VIAAVVPTDPGMQTGEALLYIDPPAAGIDCFLDNFNIGPAPRWGVKVTAGRHVLTIAGRVTAFSVVSGERRVMGSER